MTIDRHRRWLKPLPSTRRPFRLTVLAPEGFLCTDSGLRPAAGTYPIGIIEPDMKLSLHTAISTTTVKLSWLVSCSGWTAEFLVILCGFQCVRDACHKTRHPPLPDASRISSPRQIILRLSRRHWLLGPSLPFGLAVGCLLHFWRASKGLLCSHIHFARC